MTPVDGITIAIIVPLLAWTVWRGIIKDRYPNA